MNLDDPRRVHEDGDDGPKTVTETYTTCHDCNYCDVHDTFIDNFEAACTFNKKWRQIGEQWTDYDEQWPVTPKWCPVLKAKRSKQKEVAA